MLQYYYCLHGRFILKRMPARFWGGCLDCFSEESDLTSQCQLLQSSNFSLFLKLVYGYSLCSDRAFEPRVNAV